MKQPAGTYIFAPDWHYPLVHQPTKAALFDFLRRNSVKGFIFGGDQHDNAEISHHNRRKIVYKEPGAYERNTVGFDQDILTPIEQLLPPRAIKVWIKGNHEDWENQLLEEQPELIGSIERHRLLRLAHRGWQIVELGHSYSLGKLDLLHGESLKGTNHAKNAVETYAQSVAYGHFHTHQAYTKVLPQSKSDKWVGTSIPCLCDTNPGYLRHAPHAWINGFGIIELEANGNFNLYPIIVSGGKFSYGGKSYGSSL